MATYTSPTKYAAAFARRQDLVLKKIPEVIHEMAKEGGKDLRDATSGTLTKKQQRRMGAPYAKLPRSSMQLQAAKRGANLGLRDSGRRQVSRSGAVNPFPTNKWTGGTQRAIFVRKAGKNSYDVGSGSPHAKFLFAPRGTKYMKPRGVMGERRKHGQDGILRIRHRARSQGYLQVVRQANRKSVP